MFLNTWNESIKQYRGAAGALLVFDTTYRTSFLNLSQWHEDLKTYGDPDLTVVVVGNKSDLCPATSDDSDPASTPARQVSHDEAMSWAQERGLEYIETSAKTGANVEEVEHFLIPSSLPFSSIISLSNLKLKK
jgi:Ras-related protein Rab-2A